MRIRVIAPKFHHEIAFLSELSHTAVKLGHTIAWPEPDLVIQWGVRERHWPGPTLFAECGWLPRWWYQLSHRGINAQHHLAPLQLEPLDADQRWKAEAHLRRIRAGVDAPSGWGYLDVSAPAAESTPRAFILAPLQMEQDTNAENMPAELRTNQGFVDTVTRYVEQRLPKVPIIFKQHPHSEARPQLSLKMHRKGDKVYLHKHGHVYSYLKHPGCICVITANSNTANDALLWDVPTVALGSGIWPEDAFEPQNRSTYVYALMRAQWTIADARNPQRVKQAIEEALA